MKRIIITAILISLFTPIFSQTNASKNYYLKLSVGQVSFGSGDFSGYSFSFEASKNIVKRSTFALDKLLLGGELIFENGVKNPKVDDFLKSFHHVSSSILWAKASYYPLQSILRGFNIQLGPIMGYSYRSSEGYVKRSVDALGHVTRTSTLIFNNGFTYGYRISTGIEFNISKKLLTGFRLDFSNNNEGEINTLAGIKLGVKL